MCFTAWKTLLRSKKEKLRRRLLIESRDQAILRKKQKREAEKEAKRQAMLRAANPNLLA